MRAEPDPAVLLRWFYIPAPEASLKCFAVDQDKGEKTNWHDEVAKIADVPRRPSLVTCRPFKKRAVTMIDSDEQSHWRSRFARETGAAPVSIASHAKR
jgi:hypothetical protein